MYDFGKKVLVLFLCVVFCFGMCPVIAYAGVNEDTAQITASETPLSDEENPILSVSVDDFYVFENDGYLHKEQDPETGESFVRYIYAESPWVITVETTKGTFHGSILDFYTFMQENFGKTYNILSGNVQYGGEEWTLGNTYDTYVTVNGVRADYHVTVIPCEVTALSTPDQTFTEGDTITAYGESGSYQMYPDSPKTLTVTIRGKEYEGAINEVQLAIFQDISVNTTCSFSDDQLTAEWGPGVHQATIRFGGFTATYNVTIVAKESDTITVRPSCGSDGVVLNWNKVTDATAYTVYALKGSKATKLATVTDLSYRDARTLKMGTTYKYKVTATVGGVETTSDKVSVLFNPFSDVSSDSPSLEYIAWAYNNNVVKGSDGKFSPDDPCSRMNFVMILWKMHGKPAVKGKNPFKDVSGSLSVKAVKWAVKKELVKGTDATHFSPDSNLSRLNIIMIMWKLAGCPSVKGSIPFTDVTGTKTVKAVKWAYKKGIIAGVDDTHFDPDGECSRALFVEILYKYNAIYKILK